MIIFNLWAIPVGLLVLLVYWPLYKFAPGLVDGPHSTLLFGVIATIVGGATEMFGIRGRLFFMPIWLIGLVILGWQFGAPGIGIVAAIAVVVIVWFFKKGKADEMNAWQKSQAELGNGSNMDAADDIRFWTWVKAALFLPILKDFTPEVCAHNLEVLRVIGQNSHRMTQPESAVVYEFAKFLQNNRTAASAALLDQKLRDSLSKILEARIKGEAPKFVERWARNAPTPPPIPNTR